MKSQQAIEAMKILFVCMGNICRSPAAEGVMLHTLKAEHASGGVEIDSAGTVGYHIGDLADPRMRKAALKRGVKLEHHARLVKPSDLEVFDLILVMDQENLRDVLRLDPKSEHHVKVKLFRQFCTEHPGTIVPDPYYGTEQDFDHVLDLLEDGCAELTRQLKMGILI